ncbi:hypothetical protein BJ508DRAFT_311083 [Ascobolus immersus RN42]|uniref:Uncharacterized protein n=1 Tax=Ascobolus immersus RN42 TaxID=1160509 RepID=A0A3N4HRL3_ASCIM|nr:hypothetical protein BJ508DRAFT_311083 [Ascobolus immersus RN42]
MANFTLAESQIFLLGILTGTSGPSTPHGPSDDILHILHHYWYPLSNCTITKTYTFPNGTFLAFGTISNTAGVHIADVAWQMDIPNQDGRWTRVTEIVYSPELGAWEWTLIGVVEEGTLWMLEADRWRMVVTEECEWVVRRDVEGVYSKMEWVSVRRPWRFA